MRRSTFAALCCICVAAAASAQNKDETLHKVVDEAKPSIACIMVSRSERYREFNALSNGPEGKLGTFDSRSPALATGDAAKRALMRRLDLSQADSVPESYGSGVVLDASGLILTHFHVVQDATKIFVRLPGKKGSYADIYAADGRSDLAVLKLIDPPANLMPIRMGDGGKASAGDFVVGMAFPFSADFRNDGPNSAYGSVSNIVRLPPKKDPDLDRSEKKKIPELGALLRTNLRRDLGCSGAAVLNLKGELIGLTSSIIGVVGGETLGDFVVPMTADIKRIVGVLRRGQEVEYGLAGVRIESRFTNATILEATDGLPAKRAGLQAGETITAVDDEPIQSYDDLFLHVGAALAGSEVKLTVESYGRSRKVLVRLAKYKSAFPSIAANRPAAVHGLRVEFSSIYDINFAIPQGVCIRDVERGSAAERKYKDLLERARWLITSVNGKPVATPADFYREAAAVKGPLELRIVEAIRNYESTARTLTLP